MNELSDMANIVPEQYRSKLLLLLAISPYLTRALHALTSGRGLRGVFSAIWLGTNTPGTPKAKDDPRQIPLMALLCLGTVAVMLMTGCGHVNTFQRETVTAPDGTVTVRETKFKAGTFFDSKNELAKARTTMTDKTQGVAISGLDQESSGTNVVSLFEKGLEATARGTAQGLKGGL